MPPQKQSPERHSLDRIWLLLPARLGDSRNKACRGHLTEGQTRHLEAADVSATTTRNAAAIGQTSWASIARQKREANEVAFRFKFRTELSVFFNSFCFALFALEPASFSHRGAESAPKRSFRKKKFLLEDGLIHAKSPNTMIIFYGMCLAASLLFCGVIAFTYLVKG